MGPSRLKTMKHRELISLIKSPRMQKTSKLQTLHVFKSINGTLEYTKVFSMSSYEREEQILQINNYAKVHILHFF